MSDFFKKAAGLIFNLEEDREEPVLPENNTPAEKPLPESVSTPAARNPAVNDSPLAEKFYAYFRELYEKANMPGPDFFEFSNMTEAMGNVVPDEVKYPSVFAGFGSQLTKDKLLSSAERYLDIIGKDAATFEETWQAAVKSKVADRRSLITDKAVQIQQLQERIAGLNKEIAELNQLAQDEEIRLSSEKTAYHQQSALLQEKIRSGVEKIGRYIR